MNPGPALQMHIERVVLDGIDLAPGQQARFTGAFVAELARLLQAPGNRPIDELAQGGALASLVSPCLSIPPGMPPALLGRFLAATVHRALFQVQTAGPAAIGGLAGRAPATFTGSSPAPEAVAEVAPAPVTPSL